MKSKITIILLLALVSWNAAAEESIDYEPISAEELREVLEDVSSWAAETIMFRENAKNLRSREIVEQANAIRVKFDPVIILMATTEPESEYKQAGVMLLMGAKGVELALWHYIYAILGTSGKAKDYGDALLSTAVNQIHDAEELFSMLP